MLTFQISNQLKTKIAGNIRSCESENWDQQSRNQNNAEKLEMKLTWLRKVAIASEWF